MELFRSCDLGQVIFCGLWGYYASARDGRGCFLVKHGLF